MYTSFTIGGAPKEPLRNDVLFMSLVSLVRPGQQPASAFCRSTNPFTTIANIQTTTHLTRAQTPTR